jgi:hypothetical protein
VPLHEGPDGVFGVDLWVGPSAVPARLLLDTAAGVTTLVPGLAARVDPSGAPREVPLQGVADVRTREAFHGRVLLSLSREGGWLHDFPAVDYIGLPVPLGFDGIAGLHSFRGRLVTVDLSRRELALAPGALPGPDGERCLPLRMERGIPFLSVDAAGTPVEVAVDTGFFGVLHLPPRIAAGLPLEKVPAGERTVRDVHGEHRVEEHRLRGSLRLAGEVLEEPVILVGEGDPLLGTAFLRRLRITFDVDGGVVRLERGGDVPK